MIYLFLLLLSSYDWQFIIDILIVYSFFIVKKIFRYLVKAVFMKTKKSFANIVFIIFLIAITFSSLGITKDQDNDKPKMFIKNLTGDRVDKKLLERIRGKILTTIIDISGSEYNILDDDTVIAMYDQAKKIMASGCNDDSNVKQIAEGINADVIIHGEVNIDDENVTISVQRVDRNRKNS